MRTRKALVNTDVSVTMKASSVGLPPGWHGASVHSCFERHLEVEVAHGREKKVTQHTVIQMVWRGPAVLFCTPLCGQLSLCKALEGWPSLNWQDHQTLCSPGYPEEKPITRKDVKTFWELDHFTHTHTKVWSLIGYQFVPSLKDWNCKHISEQALTQAWVEIRGRMSSDL